MAIIEQKCKTILHNIEGYKYTWCLFPHRLTATAYKGCLFGCPYCYARYTRQGFSRNVTVKINAPETLRDQLQQRLKKALSRDPICLGAVSDPYQFIEKKYKISRKMLEICCQLEYPVYVVTKSSLVLRDIDILSQLSKKNLTKVVITLTSAPAEVKSKLEPRTPSVEKRLEAISILTKNGIECAVFLSPIFPYLSDNKQRLDNLIAKAAKVGVDSISSIFFRASSLSWKYFNNLLLSTYSSLAIPYYKLYRIYGERTLSNQMIPEQHYRRDILESIASSCTKYNVKFSSNEFFDLWTGPYNDCIDIDCWHAPTRYDYWHYLKSKNSWVKLEEMKTFVLSNFEVDKRYLQTLNKYWQDWTIFKGVNNIIRKEYPQIMYRYVKDTKQILNLSDTDLPLFKSPFRKKKKRVIIF